MYRDLDYAVMTSHAWVNRAEYEAQVYDKGEAELPMELQFLDLPKLHDYQEDLSHEFFMSLAECENLEIFGTRAIRSLIEYKWPLAREWTVKLLMIPYIIFLCIFAYYTTNVRPGALAGETSSKALDPYVSFFLVLACLYFARNEAIQLYESGLSYFASLWNYLDIIPPFIVIIL